MNIKAQSKINTTGQCDIAILNTQQELICVGQDQSVKVCNLENFEIIGLEVTEDIYTNCFQLSNQNVLIVTKQKICQIDPKELSKQQIVKETDKIILDTVVCNDKVYLMHKDSVTIFNMDSIQEGINLQIENCKNIKCFTDKVYIQKDNIVFEIKENTQKKQTFQAEKIFEDAQGFQDYLMQDEILYIYKDCCLYKIQDQNTQEILKIDTDDQFSKILLLDKDKVLLSYSQEIILIDLNQKQILVRNQEINGVTKVLKIDKDYIVMTHGGHVNRVNLEETFINVGKRKALQDQSDVEEEIKEQEEDKKNVDEIQQKEVQDNQEPEVNEELQDEIQQQVDEDDIFERKKTIKKQMDENLEKFCEVYPQNQFIPGACQEQQGRELLRQNIYGNIKKYNYNSKSEIEIEFSDHNLSEKLIFQNKKNYCLADINQSAFILASQGQNTEEDEYQNEEDVEELSISSIYFKEVGRRNEWEINFDQEFQIVQVTISNMLIYTLSSQDELRVFNYGGIEIFNRTLNAPLICMSAFQHLFAYVYQDSLPMYGRQNLKAEIIDFYNYQIVSSFQVSLTPYSQLIWFGYSDDGILYCQDEKGLIRMSVGNQYWVTVHRPIDDRMFWLYGVMDKELIGHRLGFEEEILQLNKSYNVFRIVPKCEVYTKDDSSSMEHRKIIYQTVDRLNERQKYNDMKHLKHTITNDFHLKSLQEKIMDYEQQQELNSKLEYDKLDLARQCIDKGDEQGALYQLLQIRQEYYFQAGIQLLEELKHKKLVQQLKEIAQERGLMMNFQNQQETEQLNTLQNQPSEKEEKLQKYLEQNKNNENIQRDFSNMELSESNNSKSNNNNMKKQKNIHQNGNHQKISKKVNNDLLGALGRMTNKKME